MHACSHCLVMQRPLSKANVTTHSVPCTPAVTVWSCRDPCRKQTLQHTLYHARLQSLFGHAETLVESKRYNTLCTMHACSHCLVMQRPLSKANVTTHSVPCTPAVTVWSCRDPRRKQTSQKYSPCNIISDFFWFRQKKCGKLIVPRFTSELMESDTVWISINHWPECQICWGHRHLHLHC